MFALRDRQEKGICAMKDKILTILKKNKLLLAFIAAALVKQIMVARLPIRVIPGTPCDDELMKNWAFSIARLDWLGDFNSYTFTKGPGFAIFLAVCYRLHLPYIFTLTLGYSLACMIFCSAFTHIFSSKKYVFAIYLLLLFNPVSFCSTVLQRVYRNGLGLILTLCVFGGLLHMYFSIGKEKKRPLFLWSVFTGLSLGFLWITKSDTIWLLPFTGTICLVMAVRLVVKLKTRGLIRCVCLCVPFLGILLCVAGVKFLHVQRYGIPSIDCYDAVMEDLTHIKSEQEMDKVPLSRKQLKEIYKISPTLAGVSDRLEKSMDSHNDYDTNPRDGEVEAGWLGWALINGFMEAGVYNSSESVNEFYRNVYAELEAAFADGRLKRRETTAAQEYYMDTPAHRRELAGRIKDTIAYMTSYRKTRARIISRKKRVANNQEFVQLTRTREAYYRQKYDYWLEGWIVFPEYEGKHLDVYVEDKEGNQYRKLKFRESGDVYGFLKGKNTILKSAKRCRLKEGWDIQDTDTKMSFYLAVYLNKQEVARLPIMDNGFGENKDISFISTIDSYSYKEEADASERSSMRAAMRLNAIGKLYRAGGGLMFWLGVISYLILTFVVIRDLRGFKFYHMDPWLISTGLGLSILVFAAGIALVDLTQCPAVSTMYLSSGYPILLAAELISLCKCLEFASAFVRDSKPHLGVEALTAGDTKMY